MKKLIPATALTALLLCASGAQAVVGVTLKAGTLGFGADATVGLHEKVNARFNFNTFGFSTTVEDDENGNDLTPELSLLTAGALLDWHPWAGGFRLSGGLYLNKNKLDITTDLSEQVEINGVEYTLSEFAGGVSFNELAPYFGIGYGNAAGRDGHWHFSFDLGVMLQGSPAIDLRAKASDPALQAELDRNLEMEEEDIEDDVEAFSFWPVLSVGVSYTF